MQEDQRASDSRKKKSRDLPSSTLWLRDEIEAARASAQSVSSRDALDQSTPLPLAASEYNDPQSAVANDAERTASSSEGHNLDARGDADATLSAAIEHAERQSDQRETRDAEIIVETDVAEPDYAAERATRASDSSYASSSDPSATEMLKTPLLGIVAAASLAVAAWSYSTLESTKSQLAAMSDAKAAVDRSLADAQGRLAAAEKAVADVKAALSRAPGAAPKAPAAPGAGTP